MKWICIFVLVSMCYAQMDTEIYLFDLDNQDGVYKLVNEKNITNRNGYDNQPYFSLDGKYVYYSSIHGEKNSDIYRYCIADGKTQQVTTTIEAEYSPTILDAQHSFSTVRVEKDNKQRIWKFTGHKPQLVAGHIEQIGYHCWLSNTTIAIFRIEKTMNLKIIYTNSTEMKHVAKNIGRALVLDPRDKKLLYVSKDNPKESTICKLHDLETLKIQQVTKTIGKGEDFACTMQGEIIMADGNKIYMYQKDSWKIIFDGKDRFSGIFNRIAINPENTQICVVYQGK
ncbi:hypothetical protein UABAM_05381 [Candidatus Uabimicrobium amorphum]|uniref:DUF5050 domain-containing protein n=1 Tax=Uabimicrobium amorphum TaxID=2596890 RepID=A0A5S9F6R9_UABAM|nr:PD40 domain-containing protein [Candidatus Uabimicrobium amorphum]BBM86979.1 hypothetical protein UABAM_05381 [Candidatus Uabimicrobium amorphum]